MGLDTSTFKYLFKPVFVDEFDTLSIDTGFWDVISGTWSQSGGVLTGSWSLGLAQTLQGVLSVDSSLVPVNATTGDIGNYTISFYATDDDLSTRFKLTGDGEDNVTVYSGSYLDFFYYGASELTSPPYTSLTDIYGEVIFSRYDTDDAFFDQSPDPYSLRTIVKKGDTYSLYMDDQLLAVFKAPAWADALMPGIGTYGTANYASVAFWSRALDDADIQKMVAANRGEKLKEFTGPEITIVMDDGQEFIIPTLPSAKVHSAISRDALFEFYVKTTDGKEVIVNNETKAKLIAAAISHNELVARNGGTWSLDTNILRADSKAYRAELITDLTWDTNWNASANMIPIVLATIVSQGSNAITGIADRLGIFDLLGVENKKYFTIEDIHAGLDYVSGFDHTKRAVALLNTTLHTIDALSYSFDTARSNVLADFATGRAVHLSELETVHRDYISAMRGIQFVEQAKGSVLDHQGWYMNAIFTLAGLVPSTKLYTAIVTAASATFSAVNGARVSDLDAELSDEVLALWEWSKHSSVFSENPIYETSQYLGGADRISGTSRRDTIIDHEYDTTIRGRGGHDTIYAYGGNDKVYGDSGNDKIFGNAGNDTLYGKAGRDILKGGDGKDELHGGKGDTDVLYGGRQADVFVFGTGDGNDIIADFEDGKDKIKITSGAGSFGELTIANQFDDVLVSFANVTILVTSIEPEQLTADDFIF